MVRFEKFKNWLTVEIGVSKFSCKSESPKRAYLRDTHAKCVSLGRSDYVALHQSNSPISRPVETDTQAREGGGQTL